MEKQNPKCGKDPQQVEDRRSEFFHKLAPSIPLLQQASIKIVYLCVNYIMVFEYRFCRDSTLEMPDYSWTHATWRACSKRSTGFLGGSSPSQLTCRGYWRKYHHE